MVRGLLSNEIDSTNPKDSRQTLIMLKAKVRAMELNHKLRISVSLLLFRNTSIQAHHSLYHLPLKHKGEELDEGNNRERTYRYWNLRVSKQNKTNWPNLPVYKSLQERISNTILKASQVWEGNQGWSDIWDRFITWKTKTWGRRGDIHITGTKRKYPSKSKETNFQKKFALKIDRARYSGTYL